ncbi:MAG TPA: hypothetical protein VKT77_17575 [Chthonomonadaceae bacterium]|nr:hypothetical protein [Chthonomonadaceae bacterium]
MASIRTVNLVWDRRVRGSYAVSRFALDDSGTVTLALPRPLEPRTYDLTRLAVDGAAEVRSTFGVETLLELEASAQSDSVIGMTSDDLYLIHSGTKTRFLPERHILLVDSALDVEGNTVVAAFSDMAGSSFAVALGEITGRVTWLLEADAALTAVAISPDGALICQAAETGAVWLFDAARRERWMFEQEQPVRALAVAARGAFTAYGTAAGAIGVIDTDGTRVWEAELPGEIVSLALAADAGVCAAMVRPAGAATTRLCVLDAAGQIGWEHEAEQRLTGLALSPSGRYLAASARDGTHTLYEVIFGQGAATAAGAGMDELLCQTETTSDARELADAVERLRAALQARPAEVAACERLLAIQAEQTRRLLAESRAKLECDDCAGALESLELLKRIAPEEPELYAALREVRDRWTERETVAADERIAASDFAGAEERLRVVLAFAPHSLEARRRLASLDARGAQEADAEAERLVATDPEGSLAALERAQRIAASADRAAKIRQAQIDMEYAQGMKAYGAKRYREAVFQFKKVLARDPDHADAKRQLKFAQRFEQDSNEALNDRFGRLE